MDLENLKIKYISEEEFLSYTDWLTRFKNPVTNLLRVCDKILTKNLIEPKLNLKKIENLSLSEKFAMTCYIWTKSLQESLNMKISDDTKLKDFLIYEELKTYNTAFLIEQIKNIEYKNPIQITDYTKIRNELFLPLDEIVSYFEKSENKPDFLKRLILKKNSLLNNENLFNEKNNFASVKILFLVEGITEEKLLPEFANVLNFNFKSNGIKLKAAGGKTHILKYYNDIRKLLKIPVFILLDYDGKDVISELNNILEDKDSVYLIEKGEIEDILPHNLIVKSLNNYYSMIGTVTENDLQMNEAMTKILYNLYKEKGFGEFHKAKFAQIIRENISSPDDTNEEIQKIIQLVLQKSAYNLAL